MKQILISLFVLLSFLFKSVQAQECYDVLASHSGFNNFYDSNLQNKACDLTQKTIEASVTETMFVGGADLYPPMSFVDETEGFEFVYDQIFQQEVAVHTAYLFFAKEFSREGNVRLKMELVLPSRDLFQQWNAIDREGIKNYLGNLLEEELAEDTNSPHRVKLAEIRVMEELTKLIEDLIDGNFSLGENSLELAGFEAIELEPGLDVILEDNPALRNTKESEKSSTSEDYILTSIQLDDGISNPVELEELIPHEISLYDLFHLSGVIITSSDLDSLQEDSGPANTLFNNPGNGHDFVVWFHYSLNPEFNRFLFFKINVSEDLAEEIVDAEFVEEMQNWGMDLELPGYKGDIEHIQEKSRSEWKWGYTLLENYLVEWYGEGGDIDCPENTDCVSPELYGAAIGCGVFDGILASVKAIWDLGKGVGNVFGGVIQKSSAYFTELIRYGIKERSLWKMHQKFTGDAIHAMKSAVAKVVSLWNTLSNLDLSKFKPFLDQIKLAITEWLGTLTSYTLDGGYELGKLVFDLVFTVATLGTGSGVVGAKFLSKFVKLLDKVEGSAFYHTLKELLDQSWALTQKGSAMAAKFYRCRILGRGCFLGQTPVYAMMGLLPIHDIEIGQWVYANAGLTDHSIASEYHFRDEFDDGIYHPWVSEDQRWLDKEDLFDQPWYIIELEMEHPTGALSQIELLRPKSWIDQYGLDREYAKLWISMPEQGLEGYATVLSLAHFRVSKIPEAEEEEDLVLQPVTGIFIHHSEDVRELIFENTESSEKDTLGVTMSHPVFSLDSEGWRLAGELVTGERVLAISGEAVVLSSRKLPGTHKVYNLEVRGQHNFLVGHHGVVVHNNCARIIAAVKKMTPAQLQNHLDDGWSFVIKSSDDVVEFFRTRRYFEELMVAYRYSKNGLKSTNPIATNFKALDAFKETSRAAVNGVTQITSNLAVSMKTTKIPNVTDWLTASNKKHINDLRLGLTEGIEWTSHKINYSKVRLDIYMPKSVYTAAKKTEWENHLKGLYPDVDFNISRLEDHIIN